MKNLAVLIFVFGSTVLFSQTLNQGILLQDPTSGNTIHETGVKYYTELIEDDPSDVQSILLRSQLYDAMGMRSEAQADLNMAMYINPYSRLYLTSDERNNFFPRRNYNYSLNSMAGYSSFKKSHILDEEYVRVFGANAVSDSTKLLMESSLMALTNEDYLRAEHFLEVVPKVDQENALYLDLQGLVYLQQGKADEAITYFDQAIEIDPKFTIAYHNRAVAYKQLGELDKADKDFDAALMQRADLAKIKFGKAKLLELKEDKVGAEDYYQDAINLQYDYVEARLNYSVLLKAAGDYTKSLLEVNKLINEFPENYENYYVRGGLYFIYGEYSNAVKDFEDYLSVNEDDVDVLFYKGLSLIMEGDLVRGCNDINSAIEDGHTKHVDLSLYMCND